MVDRSRFVLVMVAAVAASRCSTARGEIAAELACPGNTTADDILGGKSLSGIYAAVTGGDSGLGFAIARALSARGAHVVIGNRNETSGAQAAREIEKETGNKVQAVALDLGSHFSIMEFAGKYIREHGLRLHLLINNAGVAAPSKKSADGFEFVFDIDYLGHVELTELLIVPLRASRGRIINVASGAHENACEAAGWPPECFKDWTYLPPPVVRPNNVTIHTKTGSHTALASSYGVAKFLNIQHAAELARKEASFGVKAFSLTPGFALTGMTKHFDPSNPRVQDICAQQVHPDPSLPKNPCPFTADQGAAVIAHLAVGEGLESGAYYSRTWACGPRPVEMQGFTEAMQPELYARSLRWAGLDPPPANLIV